MYANRFKRSPGNRHLYGEFDSGSERTLAAWIRHASRTKETNSLLIVSLVANGLVTREQPALKRGIVLGNRV